MSVCFNPSLAALAPRPVDTDFSTPTSDPESSSTPTPDLLPEVELVYPARGCTERFALLQPKQNNEYHPIQEVLLSVGLMVDRKSRIFLQGVGSCTGGRRLIDPRCSCRLRPALAYPQIPRTADRLFQLSIRRPPFPPFLPRTRTEHPGDPVSLCRPGRPHRASPTQSL